MAYRDDILSLLSYNIKYNSSMTKDQHIKWRDFLLTGPLFPFVTDEMADYINKTMPGRDSYSYLTQDLGHLLYLYMREYYDITNGRGKA